MDRRAFYDNFGDLPYTADVAEVLARWRGQHPEDDGQDRQHCVSRCGQAPGAVAQTRPIEPASPSEEKRPGTTGRIARWAAALVAGASLLVATSVYARGTQLAEGDSVMIYSGTYDAADFVEGFSEADAAAGHALRSEAYRARHYEVIGSHDTGD